MAKKLLTIEDSLLDRVKILSVKRKTNQQALIIEAIEDYLVKFEHPQPQMDIGPTQPQMSIERSSDSF